MNIKEHIEAGHYPEGAGAVIAVVPFAAPTGMGSAAHIISTNGLGRYCLIGYYGHGHPYFAGSWDVDGSCHAEASSTPRVCVLQPPRPRKVKVTAWALIGRASGDVMRTFHDENEAREYPSVRDGAWRVIELTGEYEEPWG